MGPHLIVKLVAIENSNRPPPTMAIMVCSYVNACPKSYGFADEIMQAHHVVEPFLLAEAKHVQSFGILSCRRAKGRKNVHNQSNDMWTETQGCAIA